MGPPQGQTAESSSFVTRSVEEASHVLSEVYYDLRLEVKRADAKDFVTRINTADLGALTVGHVSFGTEIRTGYCEPGFYHVCVPLGGSFGVQEGSAPPVYTTTHKAIIYDPSRLSSGSPRPRYPLQGSMESAWSPARMSP